MGLLVGGTLLSGATPMAAPLTRYRSTSTSSSSARS